MMPSNICTSASSGGLRRGVTTTLNVRLSRASRAGTGCLGIVQGSVLPIKHDHLQQFPSHGGGFGDGDGRGSRKMRTKLQSKHKPAVSQWGLLLEGRRFPRHNTPLVGKPPRAPCLSLTTRVGLADSTQGGSSPHVGSPCLFGHVHGWAL